MSLKKRKIDKERAKERGPCIHLSGGKEGTLDRDLDSGSPTKCIMYEDKYIVRLGGTNLAPVLRCAQWHNSQFIWSHVTILTQSK